MQPVTDEKRWPEVEDPNDLLTKGGQIITAVEELEECWCRETLENSLTAADRRNLLGKNLLERYETMTLEPEEILGLRRRAWIQNALAEFKRAWHSPDVSYRATQIE